MCTSTAEDADALPAQPVTLIGDSTVEKSAIATSAPLVAAQRAGLGDGDGDGDGDGLGVGAGPAPRLSVQASIRPMSPPAVSWTRSLQVPLAGSEARFTVYVWSMLRVLPPARLWSR